MMKNETLTKKTTSSKYGVLNVILFGRNLETNHYLLIHYYFCYEKFHFLFFSANTSLFDRKL